MLSVVVDGNDRDGCHFEKFGCKLFFKVLGPIFMAKPRMYHGFILQKSIDFWLE